MPFERPTLSELITRIRSDIRSRLGITGSLVRRATANVLAVVWAGAVHLLFGFLDWLAKQLFADTAEREYLLRIAAMHGITPIAATFASGTGTATGTNGSVIPTGTVYVRDDGATYTVTADATISGGTATVSVTADTAGAAGNMDAADTLALESPITGVDTTLTIDADAEGEGLSDGLDEESTEGTRNRLLLRLQDPPQGGSDQDYEAWALEVAGVTRAWVFRHENGLGTVTVRFVRDNDVSIFPDAGEVTAVQDYIDTQRPTTAEVTVAAPVDLPVAFTFSALSPNTAAVQAAVESELTDLFAREAEPGDGAGRGTILLSQIRTAIGVADGLDDYTLTTPAADVVPALGELATKGTVTFP